METVNGFWLLKYCFSYLTADMYHTDVNVYVYRMRGSKYPKIDEAELHLMMANGFRLVFNFTIHERERDDIDRFHLRIRDEFRNMMKNLYTVMEEIPVIVSDHMNSLIFPQSWR